MTDAAWRLNRHQPQETLLAMQKSVRMLNGGQALFWNPSYRLDWEVRDGKVWSGVQQVRLSTAYTAVADFELLCALNGGNEEYWKLFMSRSLRLSRKMLMRAIHHVGTDSFFVQAAQHHLSRFTRGDELARIYMLHLDNHTAESFTVEDAQTNITKWSGELVERLLGSDLPEFDGVAAAYRPFLLPAAIEDCRARALSVKELAAIAVEEGP